ncbi:MAG: hypothetical protein JWQ09_4450 [Segetibacter sp.]|nr:hypothetical protein [Segetibacter sp.]
MKKITLLSILCIFLTTLQAQVQFVSVGNSLSGTSSFKVASFKTDGTSALLHDFKIADPTDCNGVITGPGGKLYGTTVNGGDYYNGTLFSVDTDGTNFKIIHHYKKAGTAIPPAVSPGGKLYTIITDSLYTFTPDGTTLTFISKVAPFCKRIVISDDQWIYGCGVENNSRIIFRIKTDGSAYLILHAFDTNTEGYFDVENSLVCITPTGRIFLTCSSTLNEGILVSVRTDGSDFKINKTFTSADQANYGTRPLTRGAVLHDNGKIIFTTFVGGDYYGGTIVSFDTLTSTLTKIFSFPFTLGRHGSNEVQPEIINGKLVGLNSDGLYSVAMNGTNYRQINTLPLSGYPIFSHETSANEIYYSANGGAFKNTQLLKVDAVTNVDRTIRSFGNVPEGYNPDGIIRTPNGVLYGIARNGGSEGGGTLFKMSADGASFSVIKDFSDSDGQSPVGQLLYASDGRLYGVCKRSGISGSSDSMLIYGIDANGNNYTVLHLFETGTTGNLIPELKESSSGEIAGLIGQSNSYLPPTRIFKLNKNGTGFTILKTLSTGADGNFPKHGLIFCNGYFYGVNTYGSNGGLANGSIFRIKEDGSNFSVVKYFNRGSSDGSLPEGGLTLGLDNKLYGVTILDGSNGIGTVFSLNPSDLTFQVLYNFSSSEGFISAGKLTEASDGRMYVIRESGIFGISLNGLNPIFNSSQEYYFRSAGGANLIESISYLTEIPLPVTTELCPPITSTILKSDISGTTYQWQLNIGTGFVSITDNSNYIGTNTDSLRLNNIPSSWNGYQYRCLAGGGGSKTYTLKFLNSWTGTVNNSWENTANWSCGSIPDINTDVVINSGTVLVNSNVSIRSLKVNPGVNFTVSAGFVVSVTH